MRAPDVFRTGLALCAAAVGLGAPGPSVADENEDRCAASIRGALYPANVGDEGSPDFRTFEAWLCTHDLVSHERALREGLAPGTEVYGATLEPRGKFSAKQRTAWKRAHCPEEPSAETIERAEAEFLRLADRYALADYSECRGGARLECSARVENGFAVFQARYTEFNRSTMILGLRVDGERIEDSQWVKGRHIGGEALTHALDFEDGRESMTFELETEKERCEVRAVPRRERRKYNPRRRRSD